jgi:hypothetical protein
MPGHRGAYGGTETHPFGVRKALGDSKAGVQTKVRVNSYRFRTSGFLVGLPPTDFVCGSFGQIAQIYE